METVMKKNTLIPLLLAATIVFSDTTVFASDNKALSKNKVKLVDEVSQEDTVTSIKENNNSDEENGIIENNENNSSNIISSDDEEIDEPVDKQEPIAYESSEAVISESNDSIDNDDYKLSSNNISKRDSYISGDFNYTVSNDQASITGYTGIGGDIIIPDYLGRYKVTSIGYEAFRNNKTITSVELGQYVNYIDRFAFERCSNLTNINISENIKFIGLGALDFCYSLMEIHLSKDVVLEEYDKNNLIFTAGIGLTIYAESDSTFASYYNKWYQNSDKINFYHTDYPIIKGFSFSQSDVYADLTNDTERYFYPDKYIVYETTTGSKDAYYKDFYYYDYEYLSLDGTVIKSGTLPYGSFLSGSSSGESIVKITPHYDPAKLLSNNSVLLYMPDEIIGDTLTLHYYNGTYINADTISLKVGNNTVENNVPFTIDTYTDSKYRLSISLNSNDGGEVNETYNITSSDENKASVSAESGTPLLCINGTGTVILTITCSRSGTSFRLNLDLINSGPGSLSFNDNSERNIKLKDIIDFPEFTADKHSERVIKSVSSSVLSYDSNTGKITAKSVGTGTINIKLRKADGTYLTDTIIVNITQDEVIDTTNLMVSETNLKMLVGDSKQLTAKILPANANTYNIIKWAYTGTGLIVKDGLITANKLGTYTIRVWAEDKDGATKSYLRKNVQVTVSEPEIMTTDINVSTTTINLAPGESTYINAAIVPSNSNTYNTIKWENNNPNETIIVYNDGKIYAHTAGDYTFNVKAVNASGEELQSVTKTIHVYVKEKNSNNNDDTNNDTNDDTTDNEQPKNYKISLNKKNLSVLAGQNDSSLKISSVVSDSRTYTWKSNNSSVCKVSSNGKLTAIKSGNALITVKTAEGKSASCNIKVFKGSIRLNASNINIQKNKTLKTLKLKSNKYDKDSIKSVKSNSKYLKVSYRNGIISIKGTKAGKKGIITVTTKSGAVAKCTVKIVSSTVKTKRLTTDKKSISLKSGKSTTIEITRNPISANDKLTWASSNKKVATVNSKGKIIARKKGSCTITVKSASGKKLRIKIKVK